MKKKQKKIVIGIVLILALLVFLQIQYNIFNLPLTIAPSSELKGTGEDSSILDCSTESQCVNLLNSMGMPSNFLKENNLRIECKNEVCKITR